MARNILLWGSWGCSEAMAVCHWWSRLLSAPSSASDWSPGPSPGLWLADEPGTDHPRVTRPGWGWLWPLCWSQVSQPPVALTDPGGQHTWPHVATSGDQETRDTWWQPAGYSQWLMTRGERVCTGSDLESWRDLCRHRDQGECQQSRSGMSL